MANFRVDDSELRQLAADLSNAPAELEGKIRPVVERGAVNIKNQLTSEMQSSTHFSGLAKSISYDIKGGQFFGAGVVAAEIGPEKRYGAGSGGGNLANIAYFGSSRGGGGTVPDPQGALDAEMPRFEGALGDLLEDLL